MQIILWSYGLQLSIVKNYPTHNQHNHRLVLDCTEQNSLTAVRCSRLSQRQSMSFCLTIQEHALKKYTPIPLRHQNQIHMKETQSKHSLPHK